MPGVAADGEEGRVQRRAAHRVEHDVEAARVACVRAHQVVRRRAAVVDGDRAVASHDVEVGGRRGRDDLRPARPRELHGDVPDAARAAVHEHGLPRLQPGAAVQRHVGRLIGDVQDRGGHRVDGVRHGIELGVARRDPLLVGAVGQLGDDDHALAGPPRRARPGLGHAAGRLVAGRERQRRALLIGAGAQQQVREVQPDRLDRHGRLARTGRAGRDGLQPQRVLRRTVSVDPPGARIHWDQCRSC
jgi:hypothetical protein